MPITDNSYGRIPVVFPDEPYETRGLFAAYITSFLPGTAASRRKRRANLSRQLRWWRLMTDMPVHVLASNWTADELKEDAELQRLAASGGSITPVPAQPLIRNRIACLSKFYAGDHQWGVIMDDDAILYHSPSHNSGAAFFSEMARNDLAHYADIDVFYPINPAKLPGHNQIWSTAPNHYRTRHVFKAAYDLKGSLFVVRNFRLHGRAPVLPPDTHLLHGEDTLFAIEAINNRRTVFRCENIVLKELQGPSHFQHSRDIMQAGNEAIADRYANKGLRMHARADRAHLLDRSDFVHNQLSGMPRHVAVEKPQTHTMP